MVSAVYGSAGCCNVGGSLIATADGLGVGTAVMLVTNPPSDALIPPTTLPSPPAPR